ncbi:hypothetical protein [Helicobacter burdigaliensis]|uniref:hypothetical protein n=1 Tax=Helicobacter burdigaliensis TaxID=2315334 RepID=UPI000EF718DF|nr:hypothetical protein [Helicobacter burdigaliensis]
MKKKTIEMGVNEIVEIAYGTLLNQPSISYFTNICDNLLEVREGMLFIAYDEKEIQEAIQKGAFGILFSGNFAMKDEEVAWISVEDIEFSLLRILRHYIMINNILFFALKLDEYEILDSILVNKKNYACVNGSLVQLIQKVIKGESSHIFYKNTNERLYEVVKEVHILDKIKLSEEEYSFKLISYSLFSMKILYGHTQSLEYTIPIPKLFIQSFAKVLSLAESYSLEVKLENIAMLSNFKPLYVDNKGFLAAFGSTNQVLIATEDLKLYEQFLAYFNLYAKWARLLFFVPNPYKEIFKPYVDMRFFYNKEELFNKLASEKYNFAIILGVDSKILEEHYIHNEKQTDLFEFFNEEKE